MFEAMDLTVGVANIRNFSSKMKSLPGYITSKSGGQGFAEMANKILENRSKGVNT
jgi:hypothetical protein